MLGTIAKISQDKKAVLIMLDQAADFRISEQIVVNKAKKLRTVPQNALYWQYLTWVVNPRAGDLESQGFYSKDALHETIKAWIKREHEHDFKMDKKFTTTTLTRQEFSRFFDIVNLELMIEHFGIDTSPFWTDYERFGKWQETNPGGMDDYLAERMPF